MAAIGLVINNIRIDDGEATTGYASIGGGAGSSAEGSFYYQGSLLVNRKVTSATGAGFEYVPTDDGGSTTDMTASTTNTMLLKMIVTDYAGLQATNGLRIRLGSGSGAYYDYVVAGSDAKITALGEYPVKGGFVIVPINPNVAGYRDATTGSPDLTAIDYVGIVAAFSTSSAKSENLGLDAIDIADSLVMTGGTGGDADGLFDDFLSYDEGTVANRYGLFTSSNGIYNVFGTATFGTTANEVIFNDSNQTVVFPDGYFDTGWSGLEFDLSNSATDITFDSITFLGRGGATVTDTRPIINAINGGGTFTSNACTYNSFNTITLQSGCTINDGTISGAEKIYQNGAVIDGATTIGTTEGVGVAFIESDNPSNLKNIVFNFSEGHAIEITDAGTYTLDNIVFVGYGASSGTTAAIYNNSGGAVTLNVTNGGTSTPTVRNGAGATTSIPATALISLTNLSNPSEVRIFDYASPQTEIDGQEIITGGTFSSSINVSTYSAINIAILDAGSEPPVKNIFLENNDMTNGDVTIKVNQQVDRQYDNPA